MKKIIKLCSWIGLGLIGLLLLTVAGVYANSEVRINKSYEIKPAAISISTDEAAIAEGKRIYTMRGCIDCHKETGAGGVFIDDPALGLLVAANLTGGAGGIGREYSDLDWVRAIRHGVGRDGKPLLVMPSQEFNGINDADLGALIAYLKTLPAVDTTYPASTIGPLGRGLLVADQLPLLPAELIDHEASRPTPAAPAITVEYGEYLAQTCKGCHGLGLSGGPIPGVPIEPPYPANLTPDVETGLGQWTEADFLRVFREGKRPDGSEIKPSMPWQAMGQMTDDELKAIWLYLQSVPAKTYGNR